MINPIISILKKVYIQWERLYDHVWTYVTGVPQLRYSRITPNLFLGGQYKLRAINELKDRGITAIVNMRTRTIHNKVSKYPWVTFLHLPTRDGYAPSIEHLKQGATFMQKQIDKGGKVYVHCRHGEGRGPTMAIAFLISTGMTLQDAYDVVRDTRTFAYPNKRQMERLKEFEKDLQNA